MNVIVCNRFKPMLMDLDIEVSKVIEGEFEADDIVRNFQNFYYDKMILDITAIKDYEDISHLQEISINLDMSKVILLLDDSAMCESSEFLSSIISMGIYNFTKNTEGIRYLMEHPHSYRDVAHIHNVGDFELEQMRGFSSKIRILGVKNLTNHAGATSLVYMMRKTLLQNYSVTAIEVNKRDFIYFDDPELVSTMAADLPKELMKYSSKDIILVDLNDYEDESICSDVIYLIDPGLLSLNRLLRRSRQIFEKMKGKKLVLNRSTLTDNDTLNFEYEAKTKIFYNLPNLDSRADQNIELDKLLSKLGFTKQYQSDDASPTSVEMNNVKNKIFDLFKI